MTQLEMTTSTLESSTGSASMSPRRKETLPSPSLAALSLALSTMAWVKSTPMTKPSGPTARAARRQSSPGPLPR